MTANPVSQCAERFSFFTVAASKETITPHLCPKDRCYLSSCTHCFLIPLILSRYSTFKVKCLRYLYITVATFRKLLIYYRHAGAPSYQSHHLDIFIPFYSSLIPFRYLCFGVAIFTYFQSTVVTVRLFDSTCTTIKYFCFIVYIPLFHIGHMYSTYLYLTATKLVHSIQL